MSSALTGCPDCGHSVSKSAISCPNCGKPFRPAPRVEGPYLRTRNAFTRAALWLVGIPLAFAVIVGLMEVVSVLWDGIQAAIGR